MIETVENKDEIIKNSINFIWKATSGTATAVIFNNDPLLSATLTLNDGMSNTINLDAPSCVIINRENFLKIINLVEAIQAEDINLDRQPSDISLKIDSNVQDKESSFNVDDDMLIECDYSVSQPLEVSEVIKKNKAQNLNSNNQEPIEFESDEYDDTDEERDEMIIDVLTLSLGKGKETSSAKSSTYKSQDNTAKHKSKTNETFKVAKKYDKDDNEQSFTTKDTSKEASASSSKSWQPNKNDVLSIASTIDNQANEEYVESTIICVPSDLPFVLVDDPIL
ncbi:5077_t:CDS:2, partial [Cetraspora pellucida]